MTRGHNRRNWRIMYGVREIGRWRGLTGEDAIAGLCKARGVDPRGLTAEDLGLYDADRSQRIRETQQGAMVFRDGKWVAE